MQAALVGGDNMPGKGSEPFYKVSLVPTVCKKDCPDRAFDCHAHCERYAVYQRKCEEERKKRQFEGQYHEYISGVIKRLPGKRGI